MRPITRRLVSVAVLIFAVSVVGLILALIFQWPAQLGGGSGNPNITAGELVANGTVTSLPLYAWIALTVFALLARSRRWWITLSVVVLCLLGALFRLRRVGRGLRSAHALRSSRGAHRGRRGVRRAGPGSDAIGSRGSDRQGAGEAATLACALVTSDPEPPRTSLLGTSVNKPPADVPEAAGWHHGHGVDP